MSKDNKKKKLVGSVKYTSRYSKQKFDDGGLIKKPSNIYSTRVGLGSKKELIQRERKRLYQVRYRYKKKLNKAGITVKERDAIRKVLRRSTDSLNALKNAKLVKVQSPQAKGIKPKGKLIIEDIKTWDSTDEVTNLYNSNIFKVIVVDGVRFTRLKKNFPFVLDAVAQLEVKADVIGAYYLTFTINEAKRTVLIDLNF